MPWWGYILIGAWYLFGFRYVFTYNYHYFVAHQGKWDGSELTWYSIGALIFAPAWPALVIRKYAKSHQYEGLVERITRLLLLESRAAKKAKRLHS